jgi:hypothetical protein
VLAAAGDCSRMWISALPLGRLPGLIVARWGVLFSEAADCKSHWFPLNSSLYGGSRYTKRQPH